MFMIPIIIVGSLIYFYIDSRKFYQSGYSKEAGLKYLQVRFNTGYHGEYLTFKELENIKGKHYILANAYIPKGNGETTEIDLIFLHKTGIYVIESKNYSGWIFGNEKNRNWTQTLKNGKKEKFYNPIWQNNTHIKYLKKLLGNENVNNFKSIIVFSERCTLKNIKVYSDNIRVIKRCDLVKTLNKIINKSNNVFSESEIKKMYIRINGFTNVSNSMKKKHVENINKRFG